jgi:hypothetical protein
MRKNPKANNYGQHGPPRNFEFNTQYLAHYRDDPPNEDECADKEWPEMELHLVLFDSDCDRALSFASGSLPR